jgi:hypothetical protein
VNTKQLRQIIKTESLGIRDIQHSANCGTSRYSDLPCYRGEELAKESCRLVEARRALAAKGDV